MHVTVQAYEQAMAHCSASLPNEGCGVFLGAHHAITAFQPLRNCSPHPRTRFALDPAEWIPLIYAPDQPVIGLVHSHPFSAAVPSEADHQLYWPDLPSYWIASFRDRRSPELACYRIRKSFAHGGEAAIDFLPMAYTIVT
ncbi:Mov34/MPN/PAD-1 family protein [Xylanibacillus composti]|uniref:JAB domain-containing protein n=1 Tax=Xylanibacillus composti TaxID=1572762 RepID=A0A8J4H2G3_9BACL|nr:M67 family metallopeptidase [Xylanibacillus composti]GIQ68216.1 hypothetical protein XYCOK13_10400 [Xylanibacillus composti]